MPALYCETWLEISIEAEEQPDKLIICGNVSWDCIGNPHFKCDRYVHDHTHTHRAEPGTDLET